MEGERRRMTRSICCEAAAAENVEEIFLPIPKLFKFRGKRQRRMKCVASADADIREHVRVRLHIEITSTSTLNTKFQLKVQYNKANLA